MPFHYGLGAALGRASGGPGAGSPLTRMLLRELGPGVRGALDQSPLLDSIKNISTLDRDPSKGITSSVGSAPPKPHARLSFEEQLRAALTNPQFMQQVSQLFQQQPQPVQLPPTAFPVFGQIPPLPGGIFG